jgi:hypothetical protein
MGNAGSLAGECCMRKYSHLQWQRFPYGMDKESNNFCGGNGAEKAPLPQRHSQQVQYYLIQEFITSLCKLITITKGGFTQLL